MVHSQAGCCDICSPGGPTAKAHHGAKSPAKTWLLMITDEEIIKIVHYTNVKITELLAIIGDKLSETDKKTQYKLVWDNVLTSSIEAEHY